ncbi:MAG: helix-turn-helix transcriptional regulator [Oscillospiraceae bacterium]|nr:helix-turn-helix transcriptional regulator [Oscillospiraceae bacterium]
MKSGYSVILSSLRRERGLSQRKVSEDLGISQALLSHYENGVREPRFDFVVRVCDYYGVSADYFFGRTAEKTYDDKVFIDCPDASMRGSLEAASDFLREVGAAEDGEALRTAAAEYMERFFSGALRDLRDPYAPSAPEFDAELKRAEAAFLAEARALADAAAASAEDADGDYDDE